MKIVKVKKIEGCLEGTNVRDILFDLEITKDFIEFLGDHGKLVYNPEMEKPFFRVIVRGKYTLKGSQGNKSIRVILPENSEGLIEELTAYISSY